MREALSSGVNLRMIETHYCPPQGTEVKNLYIFSRQRTFYPKDGSSSYPNFSNVYQIIQTHKPEDNTLLFVRFLYPRDFPALMSIETDSRTFSPCGEPENSLWLISSLIPSKCTQYVKHVYLSPITSYTFRCLLHHFQGDHCITYSKTTCSLQWRYIGCVV